MKFTPRMAALVLHAALVVTNATAGPLSTTALRTILLDVDNTLYRDAVYAVEAQIVARIHEFVAQELATNVSKSLKSTSASDVADDWHRRYGSTVQGLRCEVWNHQSRDVLKEKLQSFYDFVYSHIDYSSLLLAPTPLEPSRTMCTGYSHADTARHEQGALRRLLQSLSNARNIEFHIASNSPLPHVSAVLHALGLARIPWTHLWTPDMSRDEEIPFPTKHVPRAFFHGSSFWPPSNAKNTRVIMVDDSSTVLEALHSDWAHKDATLFQPIRVHHAESHVTLPQALDVAMGWSIPCESNGESTDPASYIFDQADYLRAKNVVDFDSMNPHVWHQMIDEVEQLLLPPITASSIVIVDVGAGLLSMLQLILHGHSTRLPSLLKTLHQRGVLHTTATVDYYAYEPNGNLTAAAVQQLQQWGFVPVEQSQEALSDPELLFVRSPSHEPGTLQVPCTIRVHWRAWDYRTPPTTAVTPSPHLIVGCCFADLLDPIDLVTSLLRCFLSSASVARDAMVYFPITFGGITQFLPPRPFESSDGRCNNDIPSDTRAFALYGQALDSCGHTLDPRRIETVMLDYGAECVGRGPSPWTIDPHHHTYLWRTMLYFFRSVGAPEMQAHGWNARAWLDRTTQAPKPAIHVSNVDLLFRMPRVGRWVFPRLNNVALDAPKRETYQEILFAGPRQVCATEKLRVAELQPNEIRIQTECSLISSGTELKVFTGRFDDAALDVNIADMAGERMVYPLAYGYSLVGLVVECGSAVPDASTLLGRRVFTFSAHASQVVTDRSAIQVVPDGIEALDAIFMPSVETALSLVQDARLVFGERAAVFGQGLVGLLVTALLQRHTINDSAQFGTVSTFDTLPDRLAWSAAMGSSQALFPTEANASMEFDVAIEVSGNGRALQSAIDSTRSGGRIVVGSWYGNEDVCLKLGLDFHRSHKTLKASQVSEIPIELMKTWTKARRFALTWELVHSLKPSRLVTLKTSLDRAQEAYESLEEGEEIAVAFEYL